MKIGIMQPYFLPYIGYWQLMNAVDKYVIYDDVNYIKAGWINRNRILVNGQPTYINLPLLGISQNKLINEIQVNHDPKQMAKTLRMVEMAYKKAPYFQQVFPLLEKILSCGKENAAEFIAESFRIINAYLGINTELIMSSSIEKDNSLRGQDKILAICQILGGTEYYNAIGGQELYNFDDFRQLNMELSFVKTNPITYKQYGGEFQSSLSILDVMMFNSVEEIQQMLQQFTLISASSN